MIKKTMITNRMIIKILPRGFTLLEILITLFILSIVGVMITSGLRTVLHTQGIIEQKIKTLGEIQLAVLTIERDLQQFKNKPLANMDGKTQSAFSITPTGCEFTRGGFINVITAAQDRTTQRVSYSLKGNTLYRITKTIDESNTNKASLKVLLKNIKMFRVQMIPKNNPLLDPSLQDQQTPDKKTSSVGVIIEMTGSEFGYIKRVIPLAINGFAQDENVF